MEKNLFNFFNFAISTRDLRVYNILTIYYLHLEYDTNSPDEFVIKIYNGQHRNNFPQFETLTFKKHFSNGVDYFVKLSEKYDFVELHNGNRLFSKHKLTIVNLKNILHFTMGKGMNDEVVIKYVFPENIDVMVQIKEDMKFIEKVAIKTTLMDGSHSKIESVKDMYG